MVKMGLFVKYVWSMYHINGAHLQLFCDIPVLYGIMCMLTNWLFWRHLFPELVQREHKLPGCYITYSQVHGITRQLECTITHNALCWTHYVPRTVVRFLYLVNLKQAQIYVCCQSKFASLIHIRRWSTPPQINKANEAAYRCWVTSTCLLLMQRVMAGFHALPSCFLCAHHRASGCCISTFLTSTFCILQDCVIN